MFLLRSSAVEGTQSLELVFFFPLFGINSLTHSPLAAAISLKVKNYQNRVVKSSLENISENICKYPVIVCTEIVCCKMWRVKYLEATELKLQYEYMQDQEAGCVLNTISSYQDQALVHLLTNFIIIPHTVPHFLSRDESIIKLLLRPNDGVVDKKFSCQTLRRFN